MAIIANGHQIGSLALVTLFPVILVYSLVFPFLAILLPFILLGLTFHLFFYRDPERKTEFNDFLVYAPADGRIFEADPVNNVVRIRMSLLNVHVTRMPISGTIMDIKKTKGKNWPFFLGLYRGTIENSRQEITIVSSSGEFKLHQIAGMIAQKCECYHETNTPLNQGERLGIIHYGSEVDLFFPDKKFEIIAKKNMKTTAGITPIAKSLTN